MKFYILCDIEGVASLTCWDEARSANACYAPMAREMALEAAGPWPFLRRSRRGRHRGYARRRLQH